MWLYLLPCTFHFVPAYAQLAQTHALCILSCSLLVIHIVLFLHAYAKFAHKFLTLFHWPRATCLSYSWLHTIWFYCSHTFHSFLSQNTLCFAFGSKDMITAFTCLPSYRYSSFTLREYLCCRHTYCQWPIIELAKAPPVDLPPFQSTSSVLPCTKGPFGMLLHSDKVGCLFMLPWLVPVVTASQWSISYPVQNEGFPPLDIMRLET